MAFNAKIFSPKNISTTLDSSDKLRVSFPSFLNKPTPSIDKFNEVNVGGLTNRAMLSYDSATSKFELSNADTILENLPNILETTTRNIVGGRF
jgi:hypothetical protein